MEKGWQNIKCEYLVLNGDSHDHVIFGRAALWLHGYPLERRSHVLLQLLLDPDPPGTCTVPEICENSIMRCPSANSAESVCLGLYTMTKSIM